MFGFTPTGTNWGRDTLQFGSQTVSPSGSSKNGYFVRCKFVTNNYWDILYAHTNHQHIDASNYVESSLIGPDGNVYVFGFTPSGSQSTSNLRFGTQTIGPSGSSNKGYFAVRYTIGSGFDWGVAAHSNHVYVDASDYVQSSQIGPDGFLHVFGFTPTGSQSIYNLQFGGQTITPSGSGNKGYFSTSYNPYRGFGSVSWAGGGAYSASPRNVAIDESTNRLFIHGGILERIRVISKISKETRTVRRIHTWLNTTSRWPLDLHWLGRIVVEVGIILRYPIEIQPWRHNIPYFEDAF